MRARNLKPGLFKNEVLGTADPMLTVLFAGLWCLADKAGRLEDRPLRIKGEIFPYRDNLDVNRYLTELTRLGFILRYQVSELKLIQVIKFTEHQNPHHTEKNSTYPAPPKHNRDLTVKTPTINGDTPADSLIPDSLIPEVVVLKNSTTTKRRRRNRESILSPYPPEVGQLVNTLIAKWPERQPGDNKPITVDVPRLAERIDQLLKQPEVNPELLTQAADLYLSETRRYYKHPQFFYGQPSGESAHWVTYARMANHQHSKQVTQ